MNLEFKSRRVKLWLLPVLVVVAAGAGLATLVWLPTFQTDSLPEVIGRSVPPSKTTSPTPTSPATAMDSTSLRQESVGAFTPPDHGSGQYDVAATPITPSSNSPESEAPGSPVAAPAKEKPGEIGRSLGQDAGAPEVRAPQNPSPQVIALPAFAAGGVPAAGGDAASGAPEIVIEVPAGEKVPAVFYEAESKPAPQQKMLDRIAAEFNETVTNPPPGVPEQEIWEDARRRADEQYLKLYGHAAYNARHLQSAREAVREKRALEAAAQQVDAAGSGSGAP
jgi:hypothetical protein